MYTVTITRKVQAKRSCSGVAIDSIALPGRAMRMQETGSLVSRGIGVGLIIEGASSLTWRSVKVMRGLLLLLLMTMCSCGSKDRTGDPLDDARRLAADGKFEQALQKRIWLHDHVLETHPNYYGVRLSFALAEWVELGKEYPKAQSGKREPAVSLRVKYERHRRLAPVADFIVRYEELKGRE
jgi:hypothetical protein